MNKRVVSYWVYWKDTRCGVVTKHNEGWKFYPFYQAKPSRRYWSTAQAAVSRVRPVRLEPKAYVDA